MIITKAENIAYFDIDNTLMQRVPKGLGLELDYYGTQWFIEPLDGNIEFMKSLKARGYYIIVHSGNGWQHATKVLEVLQLTQFVDEVKSKGQKYCDDQPVEEWFGPRIFFK